jgi:hypothetical protein
MVYVPFGTQTIPVGILKETGTSKCPGFTDGIAFVCYSYSDLLKMSIASQTGKSKGLRHL